MAKDDESRAGSTILKDLGLFNKSAVFFETRVEPQILTEIEDFMSSWLEKRGWGGDPTIPADSDEEEMWVAPRHWCLDEDAWVAWFTFGWRVGTESDSYVVADLFDLGDTIYGFRFEVAHRMLQGKTRTAWNTYAKTLGDHVQQLHARGWQHDGKGVFFWLVILRASCLVTAWENEDWAEALVPMEQALEELVAALPIFDAILTGANPMKE